MSLKNDDTRSRGRWSILSRLMTLYAVVTIIVLTSSSLTLHWILAKNLEGSDLIFLRNEVSNISSILKLHVGDWNALNQELVWAPESQEKSYYARVILPNGNVVMETPGMTVLFEDHNFPPASKDSLSPSVVDFYVSHKDNQIYLLMSQWVQIENYQKQTFLIQVALNISRDQVLLSKYGHDLLVVSLLALFFSLLLSYGVAKKGLAPLRNMARQVEKITAFRLSTRMTVARLPKELTLLAHSFNKMLRRMEKSFDDLSAFSSNLAHEIRTPINNLIGETDLILRSSRSEKEYQDLLVSNMEELSRLASIVERLLFLARAENSRLLTTLVELDLSIEIPALIEFHHAVAEDKKITLTASGGGKIKADLTLFRRAINNLISNALKYTGEGGTVHVSAAPWEDRWIRISVKDNGEGIPEADLPRIFDRFYRVDRMRSKHSGGTGLGLAIVKSIVELHGGSVGVKSQLDQGTEIWTDWIKDT
jgi:two-component system heavy metal sensor histidine kinase CusS